MLDITKPSDNITYLQNRVNARKQKLSISSIKLILSAFLWKLNNESHDLDEITRQKLIIDYKKSLASFKIITDNLEKDHANIHGHIPKWNDILSVRDEQLKLGNLKYHLILSLFTYIPPRRLTDYIVLKFVISDTYTTDKKFNYYVQQSKHFVFNVFKTSKAFKTQIINSTDELSSIIDNYVETNNIENEHLLLDMHDYHQLYTILNKLLHCSIDNIRHSFISFSYQSGLVDSSTLESNANNMAHSLSTHLRYRKNI